MSLSSILAVFAAVFATVVLVLLGFPSGPSREAGRRLRAIAEESSPAREKTTADIRRKERVTGVEWLNRWLTRCNLAGRTSLLLRQADITTPAEKLLLISVSGWAASGCLVYVRTGFVFPAVVISAAFFPVPLWYVLRRRAKRLDKFGQQLPEALDMFVSALRVGHSPVSAIGALAQDCADPLGGEFRTLFDEQNFGVDLRTAMTNLAQRVPLQDVRIFVAAVLIQKESGGNLAEVLSKVALTTRERLRLKKQISVHTAQGRLTGWILSVLPVALGLGMYLLNPGGMSVLWTTRIGLKMLYTAAAMIVVGCLVIRKIVSIRV